MASTSPSAASTLVIDSTTVVSLVAVTIMLAASYELSRRVLASHTPTSLRLIYVWHAFDALIHLGLEGPFLYHCLFVYGAGHSRDNYLQQPQRLYGPGYGTSPLAKLWQEYGRADARWLGADLTIVSIEILTVGIGGPLAIYICEAIRKQDAMAWFWMMILATGEIYGGECSLCLCAPN